jgi:hypothetical protein
MPNCIAIAKTGEQCSARAMHNDKYCYRHNPNISEIDKLNASSNGGSKRQVMTDVEPVSLDSVASIVSLIESNTNAVRTGEIDPKISNAVVQNINALLKVYEIAVIDNRMRQLEKKAGMISPDPLVAIGV